MAVLQASPTMASTMFNVANLMTKQLCVNAVFLNNARISADFKTKLSSHCSGAAAGLRVRDIGGCTAVRCRLNSFNDGDSVAGNSSGSGAEPDFVNTSVVDAVEVKNGSDGLLIKMRDGKYLRCVYNQPKGGYPPDYISHPAIVLKLEDGSGLLLPIIVLEMPSALMMAALHNVEMARPTVYQVLKEMIEKMGYMVKHVRVTKRVQEAYFAELCLMKVDDENEQFRFDLRPSDAINIAVRCKARIQINKSLGHEDGLKLVDTVNSTTKPLLYDGSVLSEMDRSDGQPCPESEEFILLRNMLIAAVEERYHDAAQWKDLLKQYRSRRQKWT
ncbi:bifunctional nuclease 2-like [Silene latifolia]|uniref:bifunctional nuclease 2-like n=1 Tax=Silene latifolia TaxID=37657 RepID=UPI003D775592